ncbi:MAG TPA: phospholipase D-like domain-containing protein, partial [Flavobacteriales bacterium]|nr:phospholipase D-like domain-containing protein [Flavobacteriales bacterium]
MFRSLRPLAVLSYAFALSTLHAQPVQDARNATIGSTVTFSGIVTSGSSLGTVRYVQDAGAGIAVFPGPGSVGGFAPLPGDAITITGTLTNYNGLLEVTPVTAFTVSSSGNALPTPEAITPNGVTEAREGRLVRLNGVQITATGNFASGTYTFSNGPQSAELYLRTGHPLIGTPIPVGAFDLVGIVSQYDPSSPYNSGYQLLPRDAADIIISGAIAIVGNVTQSNLTTDGFDLSWNTNMAGTSEVEFGLTPALGSFGGSATMGLAHTATLTGLAPATFYYARVFSVNGGDTAFSGIGFYSTASTSSGAIRVYFNKSVDVSVSSGVDAVALLSATDDTIKAYIDRAQSTLDIAMYNTSSNYLVSAVNAAVARGVQVRWIAEGSNDNFALDDLVNTVPVLYREDGLGSGTHDKFMIVDAEDAANTWVMSGSPNWTNQSLFEDYNNLVFLQDQALARCYRMEFEEMWGGSGPQPVEANSRFGADKTDNTPHLFNIGGKRVNSYFSPTDGVTARIGDELDAAQHRVELALYVFTQNDLADAVVAANDRPGVTVRGDMEDVDGLGSEFSFLQSQGVEMYSHYNEPDLLHHKYAIIDEGSSDPRVITGSHNWTASAETVNDENTLMIH